jgi:hypothetical protein
MLDNGKKKSKGEIALLGGGYTVGMSCMEYLCSSLMGYESGKLSESLRTACASGY